MIVRDQGQQVKDNLESGAKQRTKLRHENSTLKRRLEDETAQHGMCLAVDWHSRTVIAKTLHVRGPHDLSKVRRLVVAKGF